MTLFNATSDNEPPVISVKGVSKFYRLGKFDHNSAQTALKELFYNFFKPGFKPKEFYKELDDKKSFWALKDVSFEVRRGDRLGIIGHNGAGKSTLLKILSRVTLPTTGQITIRGKVSSLLEVGTGFHPELTGKENIYLSGAVLGLDREEIEEQVEKIISFSEIGEFLDTPVKRYSSGMYVRLAFSVVAHLNSEILILDEILAVGDAQFQEKCKNKIKEITANKAKTILFVSHNQQNILDICNRTIKLEKGHLIEAKDLL